VLRSLLPLLPILIRSITSAQDRQLMMRRLVVTSVAGGVAAILFIVALAFLIEALHEWLLMRLMPAGAAAATAGILILVALVFLVFLAIWSRRQRAVPRTGLVPPIDTSAITEAVSQPVLGAYDWVRGQPLKAVGIALGVGLLVGLFRRR
jgi:hypothetical protein